MSTELVSISSTYRDNANSNSTSDFRFTLRDSISVGESGFKKVYMEQCILPHSFYIVEDAVNNRASYAVNGGYYECTMQPGNYTSEELAVEFQRCFNNPDNGATAPQVWTMEYISTSNKISFKHDGDFNTTVIFFGSMWLLLGLQQSQYIVSPGETETSTDAPNLMPNNFFGKISFNEQSEEILQTKINRFSFSLPVESEFGDNQVYKPDKPKFLQHFQKNTIVKILRVQLFTDFDEINPVDLRGRNLEIQLRFEK